MPNMDMSQQFRQSESSQTQKAVHYISFILHSGKGKAISSENTSVDDRGAGVETGTYKRDWRELFAVMKVACNLIVV